MDYTSITEVLYAVEDAAFNLLDLKTVKKKVVGIESLHPCCGLVPSMSCYNHASNPKRLATKPWLFFTPRFFKLLHGRNYTLGIH